MEDDFYSQVFKLGVKTASIGVGRKRGFLRLVLKDGREWKTTKRHKVPDSILLEQIREWISGN